MTANENVSVNSLRATHGAVASTSGLLEVPRVAWLFAAGLVVLYAPLVLASGREWISDPNYSQGFLIFPVAAFLVWVQRREIAATERRPMLSGLILLAFALVLQVSSTLLQIRYIGMWSLVPALAGAVLLLYGPQMWRLTRFPICFLLFASTFPNTLVAQVGLWIKGLSTTGAVELTHTLGVPLARHGNFICLSSAVVEVAQVCSGYNKLIALLAFGALYGYVFSLDRARRLLLFFIAVPIAIFVNCLRIAVLILITNQQGAHGLHLAHDWAETGALLLAFACYLVIGKRLGCDTLRFTL